MEMKRKDKEQLFRLLEEKERRQNVCPVANVVWNENGQEVAAEAINLYDLILFSAGNRSGKSFWLICHIIAYMIGYKPWEVPGFKLIRNDDGTLDFPDQADIDSRYWVYRSDGLPVSIPCSTIFVTGLPLTKGTKVLKETFLELWPPEVDYKSWSGPMGTWAGIEYKGSVVNIGADTQQVQSFEAAKHAAAFFDEPVRKNVFTAVKRGLIDLHGRVLWSMTPLGDARIAWVARDFIMNEDSLEGVSIIYGNAKGNTHISQSALSKFLDDPSLSEEEREARSEGKFGTIGRAIVSTLRPDKTFIDPVNIPLDVPRMMVIDPHHSKPPCIAWFAMVSDEHFIIYREWPNTRLHKMGIPSIDIPALALKIKELEGKEKVDYRVCDPSFGRQHAKVLGVRQKSFQEQIGEYGLDFDARVDNDLDRGIESLREAFRPSPITGKSRIQVVKNCINCKDSLSLWSYEETPSGELKVSEKMKDFADVIRYGVMAAPNLTTNFYNSASYLPEDDV